MSIFKRFGRNAMGVQERAQNAAAQSAMREAVQGAVEVAVRESVAPLAAQLGQVLERVGGYPDGTSDPIPIGAPNALSALGYASPVAPGVAYGAAFAMNDPRRWRDFSDPRVRPFRAVTCDTLRYLAQTYDVLGACIAHLKDQVIKTPLRIGPREDGDTSEATDEQVGAARLFFDTPGGLGGLDASRLEFEGKWLDDLLVLGACALWFDYATLGAQQDGCPDAVLAVDSSTIRPLITPWGFAPGRTEPVYEQIVQGVRAGAFRRDEMMYAGLPIFAQTNSPYFLSPVELLVMVVMTALKSDEWNRTWLTDGNVPDRLIQVPKEWTPTQIREYSDYFDALLSGNSRERHRAKMVPEGVSVGSESRKESDFQAFDAWLRDRVCALMGVSPASVGHASDTYQYAQDGARKNTRDNRVAQLLLFRNTLYTDICRRKGWDAVRVTDAETDAEDARTRAERHQLLIASGQRTVNECRHADGLDPRPEAGADVLLVPSSLVPLSKLTEQSDGAAKPPQDGAPQPETEANAPQPDDEPDKDASVLRAELGRWERKCLNRLARGQEAACEFESEVIPAEVIATLRERLIECRDRDEVRRAFEELERFNPYHDYQGRFTSGPRQSGAYKRAKAWAIRELRRHAEKQTAKTTNKEGQIVIDIDTGEILHNNLDKTEDDKNKDGRELEEDRAVSMMDFKEGQRVGVLHTHADEFPHQDDDWKTFVQHPHITESIVVSPSRAYTLNKPDGWTPPRAMMSEAEWHMPDSKLISSNPLKWQERERQRERVGEATKSLFGGNAIDKTRDLLSLYPAATQAHQKVLMTQGYEAANQKMAKDYNIGFYHRDLPKRGTKRGEEAAFEMWRPAYGHGELTRGVAINIQHG